MSRKSFGQLLQKYLRGECTPEEKAFVEHWYGLLETETGESGQELDWTKLEDRLWSQMQQEMHRDETSDEARVIPMPTTRYRWVGIAAAVILLVGWFFFRPSTPKVGALSAQTTPVGTDWIERTNTSSKAILVRLDDGSNVHLAARSTLRFPKTFASDNRTVYLTGDAFFDIQKMPSRPFYVHTGGVVTKVLGTSFFIRTQAATKLVRVEVVTGRVAVYEETSPKKKDDNGVVLTPNQAATFFGEEQHFVTGLVDKPVMIQKPPVEVKSISFQFDDAPLSEVLERLEQAYGIAIEVENEQQQNCPLTADLTNQPLYTQLDIICAALKSSYKVQGTTILISGKGCE
ncbi:FecR family protein [Spirosoma gilvum]